MSKAKAENRPLLKRFYERAAFDAMEEGFVITLDGKTIKTPQQKMLHTTSEKLAQQIAQEWEAQATHIDTDSMPLTRLLNIALDRVAMDREALLADIAQYCETDLLCYRAPLEQALPIDSGSATLRQLQAQHFDPILAWVEQEYAAAFLTTDSMIHVQQSATSIDIIAAEFAAANDHELAALALMVPILGSALLTLAIWKGYLTPEDALSAAQLDEAVQAAKWGEDPETTARWLGKARDVKAAALFLQVHKH